MLSIIWENQFKRDYKLAIKRKLDLKKLNFIVRELENSRQLPAKNKNHRLQGNYAGCLECHIEDDWLLIYKITKTELILSRMGSHSDLF